MFIAQVLDCAPPTKELYGGGGPAAPTIDGIVFETDTRWVGARYLRVRLTEVAWRTKGLLNFGADGEVVVRVVVLLALCLACTCEAVVMA